MNGTNLHVVLLLLLLLLRMPHLLLLMVMVMLLLHLLQVMEWRHVVEVVVVGGGGGSDVEVPSGRLRLLLEAGKVGLMERSSPFVPVLKEIGQHRLNQYWQAQK